MLISIVQYSQRHVSHDVILLEVTRLQTKEGFETKNWVKYFIILISSYLLLIREFEKSRAWNWVLGMWEVNCSVSRWTVFFNRSNARGVRYKESRHRHVEIPWVVLVLWLSNFVAQISSLSYVLSLRNAKRSNTIEKPRTRKTATREHTC